MNARLLQNEATGQDLALVERVRRLVHASAGIVISVGKAAMVRARIAGPAWASRPGPPSIWSAGCSSGQEPCSIAMTLRLAGLDRGAVRIFATDLDGSVLARAATGICGEREVMSVPPALLGRNFSRVDEGWRVNAALRRMVTFRMLNVTGEWPFIGSFDAIFCLGRTVA